MLIAHLEPPPTCAPAPCMHNMNAALNQSHQVREGWPGMCSTVSHAVPWFALLPPSTAPR
jgi:hypothetical protein